MNDITNNLMTAQSPSSLGLPACGHAVTTTPRSIAIEGTTVPAHASAWAIVRDRKHVVTGDMGLAQGYFPGTTAWRPPTC